MNKEKLLERVEALREAGQLPVFLNRLTDEPINTPHIREHNAAVDAAAKALVAEIESGEEDFGRCPACGTRYLTKVKICNNPNCNRDCLHGA